MQNGGFDLVKVKEQMELVSRTRADYWENYVPKALSRIGAFINEIQKGDVGRTSWYWGWGEQEGSLGGVSHTWAYHFKLGRLTIYSICDLKSDTKNKAVVAL